MAASRKDVLVIPDLHTPFHLPGAVEFLADAARSLKPGVVVCIGDEIDAHTVSRYSHDPDMPGPKAELRRARKALGELYKLFPNVKVCRSNHTFRAYARAYDAGIPSAYLRGIREVLEAPEGWVWRDAWEIDGVRYIHGEGYSGQNAALTAARKNRQSVVMGHVHAHAGVQWDYGPRDRIYGMNVGCLINGASPAFAYAKHTASRPSLGAGMVQDGVPHFFPYTGPGA